MARPVKADSETTKRRILEAAGRLFAVHGINGASLRDIAAFAGLSQSLVSHYFGGKEQLYHAVVRGMLRELDTLGEALTADLAERPATPEELLHRAVRTGFRFTREHRDAVMLIQRSFLEKGHLDEDTLLGSLLPFLEQSSLVLAALTKTSPRALRLTVQSSIYLVVRYSLAPTHELAAIAGTTGAPEHETLAAVEEHLVETVASMTGLGRAARSSAL
ncbi:TetR family transcriptional regulator [Polyangium mundeleinium]|uniref:TetR family transcriptional regulator n=1 Tax=Polyangium mundeleinium TaxID=2995306 RepID=A0ABT5EVJ8_9BACT|nr:TetR family transcriptional regulator [Polyangium mundeleinium]MDC0744927.1 TetR family transcriptional regulator [Polyangium mundeleinium]